MIHYSFHIFTLVHPWPRRAPPPRTLQHEPLCGARAVNDAFRAEPDYSPGALFSALRRHDPRGFLDALIVAGQQAQRALGGAGDGDCHAAVSRLPFILGISGLADLSADNSALEGVGRGPLEALSAAEVRALAGEAGVSARALPGEEAERAAMAKFLPRELLLSKIVARLMVTGRRIFSENGRLVAPRR